jgi:hypothetical protein
LILTILHLNYAHKFVIGKIAEKSPLIVKDIKLGLMKDECSSGSTSDLPKN